MNLSTLLFKKHYAMFIKITFSQCNNLHIISIYNHYYTNKSEAIYNDEPFELRIKINYKKNNKQTKNRQ